jgi:glycosyltransferase involved in cell wall biosynthesis
VAEPPSPPDGGPGLRIALVYDCLYPNTIGGAERVYRNLAEHLNQRHEVTYITRRQWGEEGPRTSFETVAVSPGGPLYAASGRRRFGPPLRFGLGVFWHMLRHGHRYDAVQTISVPMFPILGTVAAIRLRRLRPRVVVDWFEVWTREYWLSYMGPLAGRLGFAVQRLCARLPDQSFTYSRLFEQRLRSYGHRAPITRLTGAYTEPPEIGPPRPRPPDRAPFALFAGRHIPEKSVPAVPPAIAAARAEIPGLRCVILGDGPDTEATRALAGRLGLAEEVEIRGRVEASEVAEAMAAAACLIHPSIREGYGLVVVEAAARGTPVVVCAAPDNAATELVEEGINGFVARSEKPADLAAAIVAAINGGEALRASTWDWYQRNREALSLESSLRAIEASYGAPPSGAVGEADEPRRPRP